MSHLQSTVRTDIRAMVGGCRIGCVSFLNAKPLIEGLCDAVDVDMRFDVPSELAAQLDAGHVDLALCPVIDYYTSRQPWCIVPVSQIGCEGPTLTVRLVSRVRIDQVRVVHTDIDSHTSVALMKIILHERFGQVPEVIPCDVKQIASKLAAATAPEALLLIGDKVVTWRAAQYAHQVDLGQAWTELTGMPFVFAIWMTRCGRDLGELPAKLRELCRRNMGRIDEIVNRHAARHGWPSDLAYRYLAKLLRFEVTDRELDAIRLFAEKAFQLGIINSLKPLQIYIGDFRLESSTCPTIQLPTRCGADAPAAAGTARKADRSGAPCGKTA